MKPKYELIAWLFLLAVVQIIAYSFCEDNATTSERLNFIISSVLFLCAVTVGMYIVVKDIV